MNLFKKAATLRRKNKRLTVPQSVKLAAKQAKKKGAPRRAAAKKVARKKVTRKRAVGAMPVISGVGGPSVASQIAATKRAVLAEIGLLEARKFAAKKVTDKRKIAKSIAAKKALFRKL